MAKCPGASLCVCKAWLAKTPCKQGAQCCADTAFHPYMGEASWKNVSEGDVMTGTCLFFLRNVKSIVFKIYVTV
jgi:hypothetical protein